MLRSIKTSKEVTNCKTVLKMMSLFIESSFNL